jgi:hypothetical protein
MNDKKLVAILQSVAGWCHKGHDSKPMKECRYCKPIEDALRYHLEMKTVADDPAMCI